MVRWERKDQISGFLVTKRNTGGPALKSALAPLFERGFDSVKIGVPTPGGQRTYKIIVRINQGIPQSPTRRLRACRRSSLNKVHSGEIIA